MGTYKNKAYPLRLDSDIMDKIRVIADNEDRPVSKQIERMLRQSIEQYENEHGTVKINMVKNDGTINTINM